MTTPSNALSALLCLPPLQSDLVSHCPTATPPCPSQRVWRAPKPGTHCANPSRMHIATR